MPFRVRQQAVNAALELPVAEAVVGASTAAGIAPAVLDGGDVGVDSALHDGDANGLPDAWEMMHFGRVGVDPDEDEDGDGLTHFGEFRAGTVPTDPLDTLTLSVRDDGGGSLTLEWPSAPFRTYALLRSERLDGAFTTATPGIAATPPTNSRAVWLGGQAVGFFRVRIE